MRHDARAGSPFFHDPGLGEAHIRFQGQAVRAGFAEQEAVR